MSDDDHPVPVTIRPAMPIDPNKITQAMDLPSRKLTPIERMIDQVTGYDKTPPGYKPEVPDPIENERLAEDEIRRLNTERENNIERKKIMGRPPGSKNKPKTDVKVPPKRIPPKRDRHETGETAPNRPLELKSRLTAVLHITTQLARPELVLFHDIMLRLERTPKGARKRIIAALSQVYP